MLYVLVAALVIVTLIYSLLIYHLEKDFKAERKDLYNRIMAGSLQDYVRGSHSDSSRNQSGIGNSIKKVMDNQYKPKT